MPIKVGLWLSGVFNLNGLRRMLKKIPTPLKAAINVGIAITDALKFGVDAGGDVLTLLIPGNLDDKIVAKLKEGLPKIAVELRLVDATLGLTNPNEVLLAAMKTIQQLGKDYKSDFLDALAVQITLLCSDGNYSWDDVKLTLKWVYDHEHKNADAE